MLAKRIIPCLDVKDGRVVKGVKFQNHRDMGDPAELAEIYSKNGADELVFYDITASPEGREVDLSWVKKVGEKISIPTLQNYAEMYEQSFALNKIKKFEWKTKKIFSKQYKFYAVDNGLANNINISKLDIEEKLLENIVYNTLAKKYPKIYYGRDDENREIDFIVPQSDGHFLKIQVSLEINAQNKKREFSNFVITDKYLKKGENILITLYGKNQTHNYKDVVIQEIPLLDFLFV
jgi:predicted AAA+ superfamily ATPase